MDSFLKYSTMAQLQTYISNYGQAIKSSIHQAQIQSTANTPRLLFTFPGFHRLPQSAAPITQENPLQHDDRQPTVVNRASQPNDNNPTNPVGTSPNPPPAMPPEPIPAPTTTDIENIQPAERPLPAPNETIQTKSQPQPRHTQQSLLSTFWRRRNIREITQPSSETDTTSDSFTDDHHQPTSVHTTPTDHDPPNHTTHHGAQITTPPTAMAARANLSYKHSKWRPSAAVREYFSQYFQPRR